MIFHNNFSLLLKICNSFLKLKYSIAGWRQVESSIVSQRGPSLSQLGGGVYWQLRKIELIDRKVMVRHPLK